MASTIAKYRVMTHWAATTATAEALECLLPKLDSASIKELSLAAPVSARLADVMNRQHDPGVVEALIKQITDPVALVRLAHHRSSRVRRAAIVNPYVPQSEIDRYFKYYLNRANYATNFAPIIARLSTAQAELLAQRPIPEYLSRSLVTQWASALTTEANAPERIIAALTDGPPVAFRFARAGVVDPVLAAVAGGTVAGLTSTDLVSALAARPLNQGLLSHYAAALESIPSAYWTASLIAVAPRLTGELLELGLTHLAPALTTLVSANAEWSTTATTADDEVLWRMVSDPTRTMALWAPLATWIRKSPARDDLVDAFLNHLAGPVHADVRIQFAKLAARLVGHHADRPLADGVQLALLAYALDAARDTPDATQKILLDQALARVLELGPDFPLHAADDEYVYRVLSYVSENNNPRQVLDVIFALDPETAPAVPSPSVVARLLTSLNPQCADVMLSYRYATWPTPEQLHTDARLRDIVDCILDLAPPETVNQLASREVTVSQRIAERLDAVCAGDSSLVATVLGLLDGDWVLTLPELIETTELLGLARRDAPSPE